MFKKLVATGALVVGISVVSVAPASAVPISPNPTHVPRTFSCKVVKPAGPHSGCSVWRTWHPSGARSWTR